MTIIALAAAAMVIQDILAVLLTQAEARNRAHLGGWLDAAMWLAGIWTTNWSLEALHSHHLAMKIGVMAAVSCANYVGTVTGTKIGRRFVKEEPAKVT